ncbi:hypothetical protein BGZ68_003049 [Mortierella alpina]|nr:hypothetical protein BGZ68_003049 [Mortierella alpina]
MKLTLATVIALLILEFIQAQNRRYPADNRATSYIASVGIGSPPTFYNLIIDTGSSNTWIGANKTKTYKPTSTSRKTGDSVSEKILHVEYGSGNFSGVEYMDQLTLTNDLVFKQSIGVANATHGFDGGVDGILGLGPTNLTKGTLSPHTDTTIPTVVDNMFTQGIIGAKVFGISFEPITNRNGTQWNGEISFGGPDPSKYTGGITYTPITKTPQVITKTLHASNFWGIDASFAYGTDAIAPTIAGIVDSGTTLLLLATDIYNTFRTATDAVHDEVTGLLTLNARQFASMKSLFVHINGVPFEMIPNALMWPRHLNTAIGGIEGKIYLIVQDLGNPSGSGLDFILGQVFMERFYTVHDAVKQQVGFARTPLTYATTN